MYIEEQIKLLIVNDDDDDAIFSSSSSSFLLKRSYYLLFLALKAAAAAGRDHLGRSRRGWQDRIYRIWSETRSSQTALLANPEQDPCLNQSLCNILGSSSQNLSDPIFSLVFTQPTVDLQINRRCMRKNWPTKREAQ